MAIRFDDRVVIVTGAGTGLGRAHALGFARLGARVVVSDLAAAGGGSAAEAVAAEIGAAGGTATAIPADVADRAAVEALVAETLRRWGRLDVVVANAGVLRDRSFGKMEQAAWDVVLAVHLTGTFNVAQAAWPAMRERGYGRIVATTSSSGLYGNFGQANYAAAKLGIVGLTRSLAVEGEKHGIRANAVAPVAWTRMTAALFPPAAETLLSPEKVTPGVLFLASEEAPNGVVLSAGGGVFAAATIVEPPGVRVADGMPTADDVAAHWPAISDATAAGPVPNGALHTMGFLARAAG